jgi:dihydrodipicolinate synthase/N-acetylneuraminate lyase
VPSTANSNGRLRGALAASLTPLRAGGAELDENCFGPLLDRYVAGGLDGVLALGTTGEGVLLSPAERRRAAELTLEAAAGRLQVAVHCGAQTTAESVALAEHAVQRGADAVAVIAPPYYAFDPEEQLRHFTAVARACEPTPFYLYEFAARSGYSVPLEVVERVRDEAPNLAGIKVSNTPFERLAPFLIEGLDVFVGAEELICRGLKGGAAGAVSGLAASFPEAVAALVRTPDAELGEQVGALRAAVGRFPFPAVMKLLLGRQGVPIREDVRPPLRTLTEAERADLERQAGDPRAAIGRALREALAAAG